MLLINAKDIEQFYEIGYFLTDVVFSAAQLQPMAAEMDRVYAEHLDEVIASGAEAQAIEEARGRRSFSQFRVCQIVCVTDYGVGTLPSKRMAN